MAVTLSEVQEYVNREAERRNGKIIPAMPSTLNKLTSAPHYYIFNVGPWEWSRQLGAKGTRTLLACPEGRNYSEPLTFPALANETVAVDMNRMEHRQEEGILPVNSFMLKGYGFTPDMSLENWGVAAIDHWPPTKEDLAEPNRRLNIKYDELIAEGDKFHDNRQIDNITEMHRIAARRRKQERKSWISSNPNLVSCKACGTDVKEGIAVCPQCNAVLDEQQARKYFPERFADKKAS